MVHKKLRMSHAISGQYKILFHSDFLPSILKISDIDIDSEVNDCESQLKPDNEKHNESTERTENIPTTYIQKHDEIKEEESLPEMQKTDSTQKPDITVSMKPESHGKGEK